MKTILCIAFLLPSLACHGQGDSKENMILQLIKNAVVADRLPSEVVNVRDSTEYAHNLVVMHASPTNQLKAGFHLQFEETEYTTWTGEELFTNDISCWIVPTNIKLDEDKASFDFVTRTIKGKQCYIGTIKGRRDNGNWILETSKFKKEKCQFDFKTMFD